MHGILSYIAMSTTTRSLGLVVDEQIHFLLVGDKIHDERICYSNYIDWTLQSNTAYKFQYPNVWKKQNCWEMTAVSWVALLADHNPTNAEENNPTVTLPSKQFNYTWKKNLLLFSIFKFFFILGADDFRSPDLCWLMGSISSSHGYSRYAEGSYPENVAAPKWQLKHCSTGVNINYFPFSIIAIKQLSIPWGQLSGYN